MLYIIYEMLFIIYKYIIVYMCIYIYGRPELLTSLLKDGFYLGSLYAFFQATLAIRRNLQKLTIPTAAISGGLTIAPQGSHC